MRDYQTFTTKSMPKDERRELGVGDVWLNSAKCKKCGDIVRSKNLHDYVQCKCGAIAVDGGSWYTKHVGQLDMVEEIIEMYDDVT